ncbi:sensor histidine kinase [Arenimonas composti]|uniref:histidine kinase n=1 Tax=Arenimonas composti TR7-09 = DSM 18010 TaxID=1121013 RepID=A0A091BFZ8_9GAMM|nr:ATP-binding protein [Arenimonas composti]KFN50671.1 hypothetical protein P873_05785 [Arenimonas composti TR7-09 = DSM 18010]
MVAEGSFRADLYYRLKVVAHAAHAASKRMRLVPRLDRSLRLRVQPEAFAHVLGNLLSNALKYAPPGSEVEVELERGGDAGDRALLRVLDRGPGVAEADRPRLFRRFQPLSAAPTGGETATGLGLALARQRARTMGGELRYAPREGGGAVFLLELPGVGGGWG